MLGKVKAFIGTIYKVIAVCLSFIIKKILFPVLRPIVHLMSIIVEKKEEKEKKQEITLIQWKQKALKDFTDWIKGLPNNLPATKDLSPDSCDLYTLLCEFVALRHEIKIQNKKQGNTLKVFNSTIDVFQKTADNFMDRSKNLSKLEENIRQTSERKAVTPFIDIRDALLNERRRIIEVTGQRGFLRRTPKGIEKITKQYEAIIKRLDDIFEMAGFCKIDTVGQSFDPRTMKVVDKRSLAYMDKGVVIEEQMSGYTYGGKIFRKAGVVINE